VLGVEDDFVHARPEERDRLADHRQILGERRAEGLGHVEVPRLAHDRRHRRARIQERPHIGVRLGGAPGAPGHAERRQLCLLERDILHAPEETEVFRVRARPPALDVVDPQRVEASREPNLVFHRERHPFALGAIAERGVVDLDQAAHGVLTMMRSRRTRCQESGQRAGGRSGVETGGEAGGAPFEGDWSDWLRHARPAR